ncbi:MAG: TonB-dependent receptor plug domain-containing protein [Betaproteobacteria bacterium]
MATAMLLLSSVVSAETRPSVGNLVELSLEQLSNIVVKSVSRREETLANAPASIYVISRDEIRRSGVTSLPEALHLAPNLQVARTDTNQYAISARGFNNVLANKLLVMIDGRTVYTPLFSGTFWEAQDVLLEDVDRIGVVSGPSATLWGANAVNGIINIITRTAQETQGALVAGGGGNRETGGSARYGGRLQGDGYYRVYGKSFHRDNSQLTNGTPIGDSSTRSQTEFRADAAGVRETRGGGDGAAAREVRVARVAVELPGDPAGRHGGEPLRRAARVRIPAGADHDAAVVDHRSGARGDGRSGLFAACRTHADA